jgi:plastocyanin
MPVRAAVNALYLLLFASCGLPTFMALGADVTQEEVTTVLIQARQFRPDRTVLHLGQRTTLVFKNLDAELHTVMPLGLFARMSPLVSGNGALEFEGEGFKRVIIPPDGTAEFHFTPTEPGEYRYVCDMPGHEMKAVIVVE